MHRADIYYYLCTLHAREDLTEDAALLVHKVILLPCASRSCCATRQGARALAPGQGRGGRGAASLPHALLELQEAAAALVPVTWGTIQPCRPRGTISSPTAGSTFVMEARPVLQRCDGEGRENSGGLGSCQGRQGDKCSDCSVIRQILAEKGCSMFCVFSCTKKPVARRSTFLAHLSLQWHCQQFLGYNTLLCPAVQRNLLFCTRFLVTSTGSCFSSPSSFPSNFSSPLVSVAVMFCRWHELLVVLRRGQQGMPWLEYHAQGTCTQVINAFLL